MKKNQLFLLLGANLGNREHTIIAAIEMIENCIGRIIKLSSIYESLPWGVQNQPDFFNQVACIETVMDIKDVLKNIQKIEKSLGRVRHEHWGARTIDIDILYCNDQIIHTQTLSVPHPYLHQRRFTLVPLAEISPDFVHPILKKTNQELLKNCADNGLVKKKP